MTARGRRVRGMLALAAALGAPAAAHAQAEGLVQIESDLSRFVRRQHVLGHGPDLDLGALPLASAAVLAHLDTLHHTARSGRMSAVDVRLLESYRGGRVSGVFGPIMARSTGTYRNGRSLGGVVGRGYALEAAPLLDLSAGPSLTVQDDSAAVPRSAWTLTRGLRVGARVGRFFVESRIAENQLVAPLQPRQPLTAPRRAYVAPRYDGGAGLDFLSSVGVVGYRGRLFEARAGRDRHRLGFARGGLLLSNYASEYDHVQLRWTLGPLSFQSLHARFLEPGQLPDGLPPIRYGTFHRVALRAGRGVEVEAFEAVVASGRDAQGRRRRYEVAYLVPFQLYRASERDLGSPDNVLLGAGAAWRVVPGVRLVAQGLLDELTAARFFEDAWTNKWAYSLGLQLADPAVPGVGRLRDTDVWMEYARLRPYVYAHRDASRAAVHYGDVLGHPAGPNASDLQLRVATRVSADVELSADASHTVRGRNTPTENYGADPYASYDDRVPEPNPTLQGVRQRVLLADVRATVRLLPDAVAGIGLSLRQTEDAETGTARAVTPLVFLRWSAAEFGPRY